MSGDFGWYYGSTTGVPAGAEAVAQGDQFFGEGRYDKALLRYQEAVRAAPDEPCYHVRLGRCAWALRQFETARQHFEQAYRLGPQSGAVHNALSEFCLAEGAIDRALFHSAAAYELSPQDPEVVTTRALILHENAQSAEAWSLIEPLLKRGYCSVPLAVLYSRLAPLVEREAAALSCLQFLLRTGKAGQADAAKLHFAAVGLLDRAGRYDEAFEHARVGKELGRRPYDPFEFNQWVDTQIFYFTPERLRTLPRASHESRRPVFIVGMPRSGTTLVEQILASHSQVFGAGELRTLASIRRSIWNSPWGSGKAYPEFLDSITGAIADELAGVYLSSIATLNETARYVTDKMSDNFLLLGLIAALFPHSHVIHCTRNPLDVCLSCYLTYFAWGQDYSHDLAHLAAFYRDYERLMTHWKKVLAYPLIEVRYESLVEDLPGQTRRLLAQLELPWEDECLQYYQSRRPVQTPGYEELRRPIDASSVGRWKNYEKHLGALFAALDPPTD